MQNFRAKAKAVETFILPKFLFEARHAQPSVKILSKCQTLVNNLFKIGRKSEISPSVLHQHLSRGGISLAHLPSKVVSAKIIDEYQYQKEINQQRFVISPDFAKLLRHLKISVEHTNGNLFINTEDNIFLRVTSGTKLRQIYNFIIAANFKEELVKNRLQKSIQRFNCSYEQLRRFTMKIWKIRGLLPAQQNLLYRLAFNCLLDKQIRWSKNFCNTPLCCF